MLFDIRNREIYLGCYMHDTMSKIMKDVPKLAQGIILLSISFVCQKKIGSDKITRYYNTVSVFL